VRLTTTLAVDHRITEVDTLLEHIAQNLVSLEDDMTCRMLQRDGRLRGRTAVAWAEARDLLIRLWQRQVALADVLAAVHEMRQGHRTLTRPQIGRLSELLQGTSVNVPAEPQPPSGLTANPDMFTHCTIDEVVAQMSSDYDVVARTVRDVAVVWVEIVPRLSDLESATSDLEARYDGAGARRSNELSHARRSIADTETLAHEDPLAVDPDAVTRISGMLERATAILEDAGSERPSDRQHESPEDRRPPEIEARDELRGLLSAYVAKARASGYAEDVALDRIRREATDVLYTAPCDLERAKTLIRAFESDLNSRTRGGGR
jgi:hypothetical protein